MKILETLFIGQNTIHLQDVDSTNNFAANMIKQTKVLNGTVILAENQFQGRGQSGNTWKSEAGKNLILSLILQSNLELSKQFLLSKISCLAIIDTLKKYKIDAEIKWPNDILVEKRKIAGILIENTIKGKNISDSIIGIGLNLNEVFRKRNNAVSTLELTGKEIDKTDFYNNLMGQIEKWYLKMEQGKYDEIDSSYTQNLYSINEIHPFTGSKNSFNAKIVGVNSLGQLKLEFDNGELKTYNNQEVKYTLD